MDENIPLNDFPEPVEKASNTPSSTGAKGGTLPSAPKKGPGRPKGGRKELAEIGYSGLIQYNGFVFEEFLKPLQGRRGMKIYREMADNDAVISAMLFAIERIILQASWQVVAGGSAQVDMDAGNFVVSCMRDMSHTWEDFISELSTMLKYGFAPFEIVYKVRKGPDMSPQSEENDGRVGWRKFALRSQETVWQWEFDEEGGVQGLWQQGPPNWERVFIPMEKLLLFRARIEKNNPEGRSILRGAYRSWYFKKTFEELEGIGVERDLVGLPVLTPPEDFDLDDSDNDETREWAQELVTHIHRDEQEGVLLPPGWKLELLGAPGQKQFDVDVIINRLDKRIAMSVLAQFMLLGMEKNGSYALSENQSDLFMLSIIGWMNSITEVINRYAIPRLFQLNPEFRSKGMKKLPKVQPVRVTPPDLTELSNFLFKLARVGLVTPDEQMASDLRRMALLVETPNDREVRVIDPASKPTPIKIAQPANMGPSGAIGDKADSTAGGAVTKAELVEILKEWSASHQAQPLNVTFDPPDVTVNVSQPDVTVNMEKAEEIGNLTVKRDDDGNITQIIKE
jgi:hypothetical protein